jgi:hypothetical protein
MVSFVEFRSFGFWCYDENLRVWLSHAVSVLDEQENDWYPWQQQAREEWSFYASLGCGGCLNLQLDELLPDYDKIEVGKSLLMKVDNKLAAYGTSISAAILNNWPNKMQGLCWEDNRTTADFRKVGYLLYKLLDGSLTTIASSPLDYLQTEVWRQL